MLSAVHGLDLHYEIAGTGPALLLLHGFTGSSASWAPCTPALANRAQTIAVDLIGHGRSAAPPDPARYDMERCVDDLVGLLDVLGLPQIHLLGYSLGGRVALQLAVAAPERIISLILESASPGLAEPAERAERVAADEALADSIERDGLPAFVERWERLPLFASQAGTLSAEARTALRTQRLGNSAVGLANSLRGMGTGRQEPLWDRLPSLIQPTLLLAGELDPKFCELARRMAVALPRARLAIVPGAGHATHLEQPAAFLDLVSEFLQGVDQ